MSKNRNTTVRIRADQAEHLRSLRVPASYVIRSAVIRWRRGDIKTDAWDTKCKKKVKERYVSLRIRLPDMGRAFPSSLLRGILDAHFSTPVDLSREIAAAERAEARVRSALKMED